MPQQPVDPGLLQVLMQRQQQQQDAQQAASGQPPPPPPPAMFKQGPFSLSGGGPDPAGLIEMLKRSGYTGSRTANIPLQPPQQSIDELKKRIDAIMGASQQGTAGY